MSIQSLKYFHLWGTGTKVDESAGPPWRLGIFNENSQEFEAVSAFPYIGIWDANGSLLVNVDGELVLNV